MHNHSHVHLDSCISRLFKKYINKANKTNIYIERSRYQVIHFLRNNYDCNCLPDRWICKRAEWRRCKQRSRDRRRGCRKLRCKHSVWQRCPGPCRWWPPAWRQGLRGCPPPRKPRRKGQAKKEGPPSAPRTRLEADPASWRTPAVASCSRRKYHLKQNHWHHWE